MMASMSEFPVRLPGEYMVPGSPFQACELTRISTQHCRANLPGRAPSPGTEVVIWIGAVGPLRATVHDNQADDVGMRFNGPLADAVVDHFASV